MRKMLTHYIALVIGGCMGFAAASILVAGESDYTLIATKCRDCRYARIETHMGDSELVCWRHGTHGEMVKPYDFCSKAEVKP